MAFHPRINGLLVRLDNREGGIVIWDGGYRAFKISEIPTSWQNLKNGAGQKLPIRIKRTGFFGFSHGVNAIAVEFN